MKIFLIVSTAHATRRADAPNLYAAPSVQHLLQNKQPLTTIAHALTGSKAKRKREETLNHPNLARILEQAAQAHNLFPTLDALATLAGALATDGVSSSELAALRPPALALAERAAATEASSLADAASARWSIVRLLGDAHVPEALLARTSHLPFSLEPAVTALLGSRSAVGVLTLPHDDEPSPAASSSCYERVRSEIPFRQETLLTADGRSVLERRHTAWLAEEGCGALAYSGKLMAPSPLAEAPTVVAIRDALEAQSGERFDCCLSNWYPTETSACKWHTDPEHGSMWDLPTSVVALGETRRFAFRRASRSAASLQHRGVVELAPSGPLGSTLDAPLVLPLFSGDVIRMYGSCNDDYEHAVLPGQSEYNVGGRVSLVFKRAIVRKGGRRGHGLMGAGRRRRATGASGAALEAGARRVGRGGSRGRGARGARRARRVS